MSDFTPPSQPLRTASGAYPALRPTELDLPDLPRMQPEAVRKVAAGLSDRALATAVSAVLFVCAAYPLLLTEVPPYQDVPNHLATATVLANPGEYPEFVSNGFLKTNAALFAWLHVMGAAVGLKAALKLFCAGVLAANAFVLPRVVLALTDRRRMLVASLFTWPMVHNWFVSMGMLDFALSVPLSLSLLLALDAHHAAPSRRGAAVIASLAFATWYTHVFSLLVVFLLAGIRVLEEARAGAAEGRGKEALRARAWSLAPLLPMAALSLVSLAAQAAEPASEWSGWVDARRALAVWELLYNAFAEFFYGFTPLSATSVVAAAGLVFVTWRARTEARGFFSPVALAVLVALYAVGPYCVTNWFHVNSRLLPFIWVAFLVRVPARVSPRLTAGLLASAALYVTGMGVDFVRLDRERQVFTQGIAAVPEGARLLPLIFRQKETSDNTRNLAHLWGFYVMEKHTSAPLLFAHSRSFPVSYVRPPPTRFNELVLEPFASSMATPDWSCSLLQSGGLTPSDCQTVWRERWKEFWADATPRFDHVLAWEITPEAEALVPPSYKAIYRNEKLVIYQRLDSHVASL